MSVSPERPKPAASYRGLMMFFGGLGIILLTGLFVLAILATGKPPGDRLALSVWAVGGIGVLTMLIGVGHELLTLLRTGRPWGLLVQVVVVGVIAGGGYLGWTWWMGAPVPGDELVALLGKPRDDPAVRSAIGRLGLDRSSDDDSRKLDWREHNLELVFDPAQRLEKIRFGRGSYSGYRGPLPYGLSSDAGEAEIRRSLGEPDAIVKHGLTEEEWAYKAKGVTVRMEFNKLRTVEVEGPPLTARLGH